MPEPSRTTLITLKAVRKAVDIALEVGNPPVEIQPPIETAARAFSNEPGKLVPSRYHSRSRRNTHEEIGWALLFASLAIMLMTLILTGYLE